MISGFLLRPIKTNYHAWDIESKSKNHEFMIRIKRCKNSARRFPDKKNTKNCKWKLETSVNSSV